MSLNNTDARAELTSLREKFGFVSKVPITAESIRRQIALVRRLIREIQRAQRRQNERLERLSELIGGE